MVMVSTTVVMPRISSLSPNSSMDTSVATTVAARSEKFLPSSKRPIRRSGRSSSFCASFAPRSPCCTRVLSR